MTKIEYEERKKRGVCVACQGSTDGKVRCIKCRSKNQEWKEANKEYLSQYRANRYSNNKERESARNKIWREANKGKIPSKIKRRKKLQEEVNALLELQEYCCAICFEPLIAGDMHRDHDHKTGMIRGITHGHCNLIIGKAMENANLLRNAADYLELGDFPVEENNNYLKYWV